MVDSFINYGNAADQISSPSYLGKTVDDEAFNFDFNPNENFGFFQRNQDYYGFNPTVDQQVDAVSNHSTHSTNHSSKHSPEYTPNTGDVRDDDAYSSVPPIVRKGIRKFYEPILDGGTIYNYEDDPNEYRKARKRIQNRESATRVRNRKKNHVEILEDDINLLKQEKAELKVMNSKLIAENNMLKQQVAYLERINQANTRINEGRNDAEQDVSRLETDGILHGDHDVHNQQGYNGMYRVAPAHKFKKHIAMLGVFTLLLCVYGLMPRTEAGALSLFSTGSNSIFKNSDSIIVSTKSGQDANGITVQNKNNNRRPRGPHGHMDSDPWTDPWAKGPRSRGEGPPGFRKDKFRRFGGENYEDSSYSVITIIEISVLVGYLLYLAYVGFTFYKHQASSKKRNVHNAKVEVLSV